MLFYKDNFFFNIFVLMRFRVIFVESQKWEMMIVNNDAFFASVIDLLREGKRVTIPVKGTSMLPFIVAERDLVVLEGIEATSPAGKPRRLADRGDVVLFRFNNHYVLHRVLDFAAGGDAVIQGDGVLAAKEHCTRDEIYARVVSILKDGTRPVDVTSKIYLLKVRIWLLATPFRRILLGIRRRLEWLSASK